MSRYLSAFPAIAAILISAGCSAFTTVVTNGDVTVTKHQRAELDALEEVYDACYDPLVISGQPVDLQACNANWSALSTDA